ncbi:MAG: hypothetical protein Q3972_05315 [Corynebacterium sp.]|nr:hypothetical protein [Corynebacterium sp.]
MSLKKKLLAVSLATATAMSAVSAPQANAADNAITKLGTEAYTSSLRGSTEGSSGSSQTSLFWYAQMLNPLLILSALISSIGNLSLDPITSHFKAMRLLASWVS